jgi:OmpA-OmpF porin, OOP family
MNTKQRAVTASSVFFAAAALAAAFIAAPASAQPAQSTAGYVVGGNSGLIARGATGVCWHAGYWTPAMAVEECDPGLAPRQVADATPAPRAAPPAPASPPPAPRPRFEKVVLDSEVLFDFNKAVLKPAALPLLDEVVTSIKDKDSDIIVITGHTDRIGSVSYNQKLSERRAAAVKDYFRSKGIAESRMQAVGKGKSEPVTTDCVGTKKTPRLIACLAPDRRVEVESKIQRPMASDKR